MPADLYSDAEPAAPEAPEAAPQEAEEPTAELPKAVLGGKEFKPGEEVVLQVVQVLEDSVLVKYASGEKEEPSPEAEAPAQPAAAPPGPGGAMGLYD